MKGVMSLLSITELAEDYLSEAEKLDIIIEKLKLKRKCASGQKLCDLNYKITIYEDMRDNMKATAATLRHYYDE